DDARARHFAVVHVTGGELTDFEERRAGVEQPLDPITRQELAALDMPLAVLLGPAFRGFGDIRTQLLRERAIVFGPRAELVTLGNDFTVDPRRAHAPRQARWSKSPAARLAAAAGVGKAVAGGSKRMKRPILIIAASLAALTACSRSTSENAAQEQGRGTDV